MATNRPNPYEFPDAFKNLAAGLPSYETRQCASGPVPTLVTQPQPGLPIDPLSLIPADLAANMQKFFFGTTSQRGRRRPRLQAAGQVPVRRRGHPVPARQPGQRRARRAPRRTP